MTTVKDVLIYEALENDKRYRAEKKKILADSKMKVKIEKGKSRNNDKKSKVSPSKIGLKQAKTKSKGILVSKRKNTGEKQLFETIRNSRPHYCILCKKYIEEAKSRCFAHLLAKGMYPKYRLNEANIALVCSIECHHKVDSMIVGYKKEIKDKLDLGANFNYIIKILGANTTQKK